MDYKPYKQFKNIISHPDLLGGKLTVRGTRISVSHVLECLAAGMDVNDINESFETNFTQEVIAEVLQAASDITAEPKIAAAG